MKVSALPEGYKIMTVTVQHCRYTQFYCVAKNEPAVREAEDDFFKYFFKESFYFWDDEEYRFDFIDTPKKEFDVHASECTFIVDDKIFGDYEAALARLKEIKEQQEKAYVDPKQLKLL